jgi:hypothetical protein
MKLPQVSTAFMLASSMVQRAMAEGPQAMAEGPQDTSGYDARAALFLLPFGVALMLCCCICYSKTENFGGLGRDSRRRVSVSTAELDGVPSAPLPLPTGVLVSPASAEQVSADLVLANPQSIPIGQLSPSPEALALSASPSLATIPNSSDPV